MQKSPTNIKLRKTSRLLEVHYDETIFTFPHEYLRVHSPSAEVQGHGPGQEVLQYGKEEVSVTAIEPVGHYAIRLIFNDQHNSGIFSWDYLFDLGQNMQSNWLKYLARLEQAGHKRFPQENDKYFK